MNDMAYTGKKDPINAPSNAPNDCCGGEVNYHYPSCDKPTASGEWTVEFDNMIYAGDEFIAIITDYESRTRVVKMHNTAVERVKTQTVQ
jgi:hypothetical protein